MRRFSLFTSGIRSCTDNALIRNDRLPATDIFASTHRCKQQLLLLRGRVPDTNTKGSFFRHLRWPILIIPSTKQIDTNQYMRAKHENRKKNCVYTRETQLAAAATAATIKTNKCLLRSTFD
uniref:(northern house mosquito) hypothetical protein n=1 Tax=Culex pipiens TaxID=7175 RepID=A0A8D8DV28_CULPI